MDITGDWTGGHLMVCTYLAAFSEEPRWLQGFREGRKPSKPKKQAGFQETSVTVFCIRQRAPSGWETTPAANFFLRCSQLLPAHFWDGLLPVSLWGKKAPSHHTIGKARCRKSSLPQAALGIIPVEHLPKWRYSREAPKFCQWIEPDQHFISSP